ncbi:sigma 54-interacting transcriptional regulator [candidate division WOR-3 bacterium]|nr:sigma 54-interacting transcriptional regulator [candidate division WOR-3 bacterium]
MISQEAYEDFLDKFSDGVVAIDKNLRIISFSKGAERITGYAAAEITGKTCKEIFKSNMCDKGCPVKNVIETGQPVSNIHNDIKNSKNETIPISVNVSPLLNIHRELIGAVLSFRNVLEIYHLTAELFKESTLLQSILDSIAEGVFTVDTKWQVTSFNPSAEKITGYKKEEVIGKSCSVVLESNICFKDCPLKKTIETGKTIANVETFITDKQGRKVPVSVSTALLIDEEGEIIGGVETLRDLTVLKQLTNELKGRYSFGNIVGKNPKMQKIYNLIEAVSNTNSTVLVLGETGTGKDLVARAIHYNSPRKNKPFIKVSCAALPESLLESELFGHKKGAFTGAVRDKPGRFNLADGGTIFLDEVGEIPVTVQVKLLRVLEEQEFEPLGGTKPIKVDIRIIAASNRDLKEAMKSGKFREDLFYRLNVVPVSLPALWERKDDIPLLVKHFIKKFNKETGRNILSVSRKAMELLLDNSWVGNVRQLENTIEYAFIHCDGRTIQIQHLPEDIRIKKESEEILDTESPLEEIEKHVIERALKNNNNDREKTAHLLQISRTTLWRKMKKYGIG